MTEWSCSQKVSMTQNMVTVNGVDVSSTLAPPTHINIHIHQESALPHLKELICCPWNTGPPKTRIRYGQLAIGVTQIWLGAVSCALGVFLYLGPWFDLRGSGCAFWAGSVAIAAGAGTIIHDKHRNKLSGCVSGLLTLAGVATAMAALVLCVDSVIWESVNFFFMEVDVCDHAALATTPAWYTWNQQSSYQDSNWLEDRCRAYIAMLMNLFQGIRILLLVVCALLVIASLASLGMGLRSLCGQCSRPLDEEESEKKLLGENSVPSSPSKEKTKAAIIL